MKNCYFIFLFLLFFSTLIHATGGYDNGSPVGKGKVELDFTLNPANVVPYGQSYMTWNYGLSDKISFHGYVSNESKKNINQIYYGLKYTFFQNSSWDFSTAIGLRNRASETYIYLPQLLYTYKLSKGYDIGGSIVYVYNKTASKSLGTTYDFAIRIPFELDFLKEYVESTKLALGAFRNASGNLYPTYSIDFKF